MDFGKAYFECEKEWGDLNEQADGDVGERLLECRCRRADPSRSNADAAIPSSLFKQKTELYNRK